MDMPDEDAKKLIKRDRVRLARELQIFSRMGYRACELGTLIVTYEGVPVAVEVVPMTIIDPDPSRWGTLDL
jgi:hypothetical protein